MNAPRRYIHLKLWGDDYEVLVAGTTIIRIHKYYADSGLIRPTEFEDLPDGLKDQLIKAISAVDYEI